MAHQPQQQDGLRGLAPIVCLLVGACLAGPAWSDNGSPTIAESRSQPEFQLSLAVGVEDGSRVARPALRRDASPRSSGQFYRSHFLPNVARRLDAVRAVDIVQHGRELDQHVYFARWTETTRRSMKNATRDAVRNYLLEDTSLRRLVAAVDRLGSGRASVEHVEHKVDFDLAISHSRPQLQMRYRLDDRTLKLSLDSNLILGFEFQNSAWTRNSVSAKLDARRGSYVLSYRVGF